MAKALISSHGHQTILLESPHLQNCEFCILPKPAVYHCVECNANLCGDCFEIPHEIAHSHCQGHILRLTLIRKLPNYIDKHFYRIGFGFMICRGCHYISLPRGHYRCDHCEFTMCVECGTSSTSKIPLVWESNKELSHWSDLHRLVRCRFREYDLVVEKFRYECKVCELSMWGEGYACLDIMCKNFIHDSCIDTPRGMHHSLHPHHPLTRPEATTLYSNLIQCRSCRQDFPLDNLTTFQCKRCEFALHFQCAISALRPVKLGSHEHNLRSMVLTDPSSECYVCKNRVQNQGLSCVECQKFFHAECVSAPRELEHKHHEHRLTLMDGLPYASDKNPYSEYSCDICEGMIKDATSIHVYGCNLCKFYAHIECILSEENGFAELSLWGSNHSIGKEIRMVIHEHPLSMRHGNDRIL